MIPLVRFAMEQYENDPCERFGVNFREDAYDVRDIKIDEKERIMIIRE